MRIYKEQNSKNEFIDIVNELTALTKKLQEYCTSDEAYNSLLKGVDKEGR